MGYAVGAARNVARVLSAAMLGLVCIGVTPEFANAQLRAATSRSGAGLHWEAPRREGGVGLRELWNTLTTPSKPGMVYPGALFFSKDGLIVYDHGEKRLHFLDSRSGRDLAQVGRGGSGPGEFNGRPAVFLGTYLSPTVVEWGTARTHRIEKRKLVSVRSPREREWWFEGCAWGPNRILRETVGARPARLGTGVVVADHVMLSLGDSARVLDSIPLPWERMTVLSPIVRQTYTRQLNDSLCAILPVYHREFAVAEPGKPLRLGLHVESLPEAKLHVAKEGEAQVNRVAAGARRGGIDAQVWRDLLLVLFVGQSDRKSRLLDMYDLATLTYRGSLALPHKTDRFVVRGDTLAAIAEIDLEPVVIAYLLRPAR